MRIAFDEQIFVRQKYGGVSRYVCSLARELNRLPDTVARIFAPYHVNRHLAEIDDAVAEGRLTSLPSLLGRRGPFIRAFRALSASSGQRKRLAFSPDVLHETYFSEDRRPAGKAATILTVYDMIHELFPGDFGPGDPTTRRKQASVARADRVICISESTRSDLIERFGVPEEKAVVVYLGFDRLPKSDGGAELPSLARAPYLLYVGQRAGYKNFTGLVSAYASSPQLRKSFRLVCFGGGSLSRAELTMIKRLGLPSDAVVQISGDDRLLAQYYAHAAAFIYPSLYEGFGIPPLEAMSLGCPVICSQTSSIPEVVGDAAALFDPHDVEAIRFVLESTMESDEAREDLVKKGRRRADHFSWHDCARNTLNIYRQLV